MTEQDVNSAVAARVASALGQAIIDSIANAARAEALASQLAQSREHLMELETDVANLRTQVESLQPQASADIEEAFDSLDD